MKRLPRKSGKKRKTKLPSQRVIAFGVLGISVALLAFNGAVFLAYRSKTYPKTRLNSTAIGTVSFDQIEQKTKEIISPPDTITLKLKDKSKETSSEQLGISVNYASVSQNVRQNRLLIPMLNFFVTKNNQATYNVDESIIRSTLDTIKAELEVPATQAHVSLQNSQFIAVPAQMAISIDADHAHHAIISQLHDGKTEIDLPTEDSPEPESPINIDDEAAKLNNSIDTVITLNYNGQNKTLTKTQIANLYEPKDGTFIVSATRVNTLLDAIAKQLGIALSNRQQAATTLTAALQNNRKTDIVLQAAPQKRITYTYCVAAKGVDESYLGTLKSKLQAVYGDSRGWSVGGQVQFTPVASGCSFTVWLTAANLVPSFSSTICDNIWSCRVGNNVILNFDRWTGASPAWNNAGGSLDDYRSMVINHETGHWLGFGHRYCGGTSQAAPVMQQQSIGLQGCNFNPWPTASEIQALKKSKGL